MTPEEIEAAKLAKKTAIKAYINDSDATRSNTAIKILINAMITNAGSLDNLTLINAALDAALGGP